FSFFFSSRRRHTRFSRDWSSDVCSSDLDDNPRTESPQQIVKDILAGVPAEAQPKVLHDREQAIAWAIEQADDKDIVLIAGKGHETYQEVQGERLTDRMR